MQCKIIFTSGYDDDLESLLRGIRGDVLLTDEHGNYYELNILTLDRVKAEFSPEKLCYLENNMMLLHEITKETILKAIPELYNWQFYKRWIALTKEQLEKYYHPKDTWVTFAMEV